MSDWVTLLCSRNWHITVSQLYFSKNMKKKSTMVLQFAQYSVNIWTSKRDVHTKYDSMHTKCPEEGHLQKVEEWLLGAGRGWDAEGVLTKRNRFPFWGDEMF